MAESLESLLVDTLGQSEASCAGDPVDPVDLAEYLDGVLPEHRRAVLEAHLAECPACRQWATEAGLAMAQDSPVEWRPQPPGKPATMRRRRSRRLLAAAAIVAGVTLAGLVLQHRQGAGSAAQLAAFGVDRAAVEQAGTDHRRRLHQALRAEIGEVDYFVDFLDSGERSALRGGSLADGPRIAAPRWSALRDPRPVLRWYPGETGADDRREGEILIVDDREQLVATLPYDFAVAEPGASLELSWPEEQASLEPNRTYAWKVNAVLDGEWQASAYVPFRVLDPVIVTEHLVTFGDNRFRVGVEMGHLGLYDDALATLARILDEKQLYDEPAAAVVERLAGAILVRKKLSDDLMKQELQRWLASARKTDDTQ